MKNANDADGILIVKKVEPDCFKTNDRPGTKILQLWVTRSVRRGGTRVFGDGCSSQTNSFSEPDGDGGEIQGNEVVTKLTSHIIP